MNEKEISEELNYAVYLRVREIMEDFGIESISDLSERAGISKSTISSLQIQGQGKTVTLKTIHSICDAVGITVYEFFDSPLFRIRNKL